MNDGSTKTTTTASSAKAGRSSKLKVASLLKVPLEKTQTNLASLKPQDRLTWAIKQFGSGFVITTSFGIQSAVLLHMLQSRNDGRNVPVIWVDTGYLPPETYLYADQLTEQLDLDLKVVRSSLSPARMEALQGRLWETGSVKDLEAYHRIRKVEPLEQALEDLQVSCWASGVRSDQTEHRSSMNWLELIRGRYSLRPLLDWTSKDVFYYMQEHDLPQHPLFEKGYSTVGDWHSSAPDGEEATGRETRFGGLKQECGLHLPGVMGEGI